MFSTQVFTIIFGFSLQILVVTPSIHYYPLIFISYPLWVIVRWVKEACPHCPRPLIDSKCHFQRIVFFWGQFL